MSTYERTYLVHMSICLFYVYVDLQVWNLLSEDHQENPKRKILHNKGVSVWHDKLRHTVY